MEPHCRLASQPIIGSTGCGLAASRWFVSSLLGSPQLLLHMVKIVWTDIIAEGLLSHGRPGSFWMHNWLYHRNVPISSRFDEEGLKILLGDRSRPIISVRRRLIFLKPMSSNLHIPREFLRTDDELIELDGRRRHAWQWPKPL